MHGCKHGLPFCQTVCAIWFRASPNSGGAGMTKRRRIMLPRRAAVLLLASASNQTLLAALTVGSFNAPLLSSASAATCVTGVTSTFANVISGVTGQPGATVVTAVTPTFTNAVTGVQTTPGSFLTGASLNTTSTNVVGGVRGQTGTAVTAVAPTFGTALTSVNTTTTSGSFLTGATLNQATGTAVTSVTAQTTSVTGLNPGATSNLLVPAFDPASNPPGTKFAFTSGGGTTTNGSGTVELVNPNPPRQRHGADRAGREWHSGAPARHASSARRQVRRRCGSCRRHNKVGRSFLSGSGFSLSSKFKFNGRSMERASI